MTRETKITAAIATQYAGGGVMLAAGLMPNMRMSNRAALFAAGAIASIAGEKIARHQIELGHDEFVVERRKRAYEFAQKCNTEKGA